MIKLDVSKYNKNACIDYSADVNYAEATVFQEDLLMPFTKKYMNMLKTYFYLPIDSNAMGHETRKVWENDSTKFRFIKHESPDINTETFYYEMIV